MSTLSEISAWLDRELRIDLPDYGGAVNGLQLENRGEVRRIVAAVDASLPVVSKAAAHAHSLLLVHHGMFWQGVKPITGAWYRKLQAAMHGDLAIYSAHLPLDVHPQLGNNVLLAQAFGLTAIAPFFEWQGIQLGVSGEWLGKRDALVTAVESAVEGSVHVCPAGPETVSQVAVITGGAGSQVEEVARLGFDTLITGEGPHWSYSLAEELGVNLIYAGHYATETFGVKALATDLGARFKLPWVFIDHPTGL